MRLTYVGHATVLIELDGLRFLTDPLLTRWVGPLRRQWPAVDPDRLRAIDAVLLSHLHYDHCHFPSLAQVNNGARLTVPCGSGSFLRSGGLRDIDEVRPGDRFTVGTVDVRVVQAVHEAGRPFSGVSAAPQGFILHGSQTVYFAGDTDIFSEMSDLDAAIDVALIPVWGWGPNLGPGHLDPARAAEAIRLLRPRIAIPIHWGTYFPAGLPWGRRIALQDAPRLFMQIASKVAPGVKVRIIEPGGSMVIPS